MLATLTPVALGVYIHQRDAAEQARLIRLTQERLRQIERQVSLHAIVEGEINHYGFPAEIDPAWFENNVPTHPMLSGDRPWVEIAAERDQSLWDPPDRVADDGDAAFWYNPRLGVVRARVPQMLSDLKTLETYNLINGSRLADLFAVDRPEPEESTRRRAAPRTDGGSQVRLISPPTDGPTLPPTVPGEDD